MPGGPQAVLIGAAQCVGRHLLLRSRIGQRVLRGRHHIQIEGEDLTLEMIQHERQLLPVQLGNAESGPVARPDQHIAQAGVQTGAALRIRRDARYGAEIAVIEDLVFDLDAGHRLPVLIDDRDRGPARGDVVADHVDLGIDGILDDDVLRSLVVAGHLSVEQQRARHGGMEPAHVEFGIRLAGAQVIPRAIHPGFHPGMVAVGMGPERRIDLPGRDAGRTQGGHRESRFLAAAAETGGHQRHGAAGARIRSHIGHPFVAPVVDLQHGVVHGHPLHALAKFVGIEGAEAVQVFIVDTEGQDEMAKLALRDAPGHPIPHLEGLGDGFFPVGTGVDQAVRERHRLVKIVHIAVAAQRLVSRTGHDRSDKKQACQDGTEGKASHKRYQISNHSNIHNMLQRAKLFSTKHQLIK